MSNVWTESEYLMKKNDRNHTKKFLDDFPSGGGHVYAKNVKKSQKSKKANILETVEIKQHIIILLVSLLLQMITYLNKEQY